MRRIYLLLALVVSATLLRAQTTPSVNFTFSLNATLNDVVFTNTSLTLGDGVKKAYWTFGDGSLQVTGAYDGATHHYAAAGTYQACLKIYKYTTSIDSLLLGSECKSVVIQQACTATYQFHDSISTNSFVHQVSFYGSGTSTGNKPITHICWTFGDGHDTCITATAGTSITTFLNIRHEYHQNGTYNACLKITYDGGCIGEKCNTIVLNAPTVADSCTANYTVQPTTASALGKKFIAQPWHSNNKKPVRICWTFGDGKDTCIQYAASYTGDYWVEHHYANYGQYEVCVTITYDGGCEKRKCNTVVVSSPTPVADTCTFTLNETATNLSNLERKFYVGLQANKVAERICWNFGDGTDTCVVLTNPVNSLQLMMVHHYAAPGNYNVCAKVTYIGACTVQRCRTVSIAIAHSNICGGYLTDSVTSANTIHFTGTGIQNASDYVISYNWTFGDGASGSGQGINHTYGGPGHYNVCLYLKTNSGCETRICKQVEAAGTNQPQLILSPNPVVSTLTALFHSLYQQTLTVKIYNANGLMVRSYVRSANVGSNTWTFDAGALPTGVYSVIVQSSNQFATSIFFKQ